MDRNAIEGIVEDWIDELSAEEVFAWLRGAQIDVSPAFLVDHETKDGDDYKAGAVSITITSSEPVTDEQVEQLYDFVVADRTLGQSAKDARLEKSSDDAEVGRLIVIPR